MVKAVPGRLMVLKRSVRWAKSGSTWAPLVTPSKPGQLEAQANLAEAAFEAKERGLINVNGLPGAAGYVKTALAGKSTNPDYYRAKATAAAEYHRRVPEIARALRDRAASMRSGASGARL